MISDLHNPFRFIFSPFLIGKLQRNAYAKTMAVQILAEKEESSEKEYSSPSREHSSDKENCEDTERPSNKEHSSEIEHASEKGHSYLPSPSQMSLSKTDSKVIKGSIMIANALRSAGIDYIFGGKSTIYGIPHFKYDLNFIKIQFFYDMHFSFYVVMIFK